MNTSPIPFPREVFLRVNLEHLLLGTNILHVRIKILTDRDLYSSITCTAQTSVQLTENVNAALDFQRC